MKGKLSLHMFSLFEDIVDLTDHKWLNKVKIKEKNKAQYFESTGYLFKPPFSRILFFCHCFTSA